MPIGITITRPELADVFKGPHINTFGGNPLSSTAALATIEVIEKEGLVANAKRQGETLLVGLRELQKRYPSVGEVRGRGLMIGVELVEDPKTKAVSPAKAAGLMEALRKRGVLVGKGGRYNNVIRIQPPLIFSDADSNEFLQAFGEALGSL